MKAKEIHAMKDAELGLEVTKLRASLFQLRAKRSSESVEKTSDFRATRKDIARLLTEQRMRVIKSEGGSAGTQHRKPKAPAAKPVGKPLVKTPTGKITSSAGAKKTAAKRAPAARKAAGAGGKK